MEYVAGEFWCPGCAQKSEFVVVEGHSPTDHRSPIECWQCGYTYDKVVHHLEDDGQTHRAVPKVVNAIPKWARVKARAEVRDKFQASAEKAGFLRENFTKPGTRKKSD
jgi:hypothetical protein